jgi:hypothetical protein
MNTKQTYVMWEQFDDTKGAIWSRKTKNGQKKMEKQRSTKHYIEPKRSSNTNATENRGWIRAIYVQNRYCIDLQ